APAASDRVSRRRPVRARRPPVGRAPRSSRRRLVPAGAGRGGAAWRTPNVMETTMTTKDLVLQVLEQLPEDAEIEDVIERLYFVRRLQLRLDETDAEETFTQEEARRRLERWLK